MTATPGLVDLATQKVEDYHRSEEELVSVVVGEVVNPGKLFLQLELEQEQLTLLMDGLEQFYCYERSQDDSFLVAAEEVVVGKLYAVTWTDENYYRARVRNRKNAISVEMFYVDYGTVAVVEILRLRRLDPRFYFLPAQAVQCQLSDIVPPLATARWSGTATSRLRKLTANSSVDPHQAIIRGNVGDKLSVWLIDSQGRGVNETLVSEGLADFTDKITREVQIEKVTSQKILSDELMDINKKVTKVNPEDISSIASLLKKTISFRKKTIPEVKKYDIETDIGPKAVHVLFHEGNHWVLSWEIASLVKGRQLTEKLLNERAACSSQSSFMKRGGDLLWPYMKEVIPHRRLEITGDEVRIVRLSEAAEVVRNIPESCQNTARALFALALKLKSSS